MSNNEMIIGMVNDLLEKGEEEYQTCKLMLLNQTTHSAKLRDFICKLFAYTDKRRPLLIGMNKQILRIYSEDTHIHQYNARCATNTTGQLFEAKKEREPDATRV